MIREAEEQGKIGCHPTFMARLLQEPLSGRGFKFGSKVSKFSPEEGKKEKKISIKGNGLILKRKKIQRSLTCKALQQKRRPS